VAASEFLRFIAKSNAYGADIDATYCSLKHYVLSAETGAKCCISARIKDFFAAHVMMKSPFWDERAGCEARPG
jgi:hypothetical protein